MRDHRMSVTGLAVKEVGVAVVLLVVQQVLTGWSSGVGYLARTIVVLVLLYRWVRVALAYFGEQFTVAPDSIRHRTGLIARKVTEVPRSAISQVEAEQTVVGRLLGYGDLVVQSSGPAGHAPGTIRFGPVDRIPELLALLRPPGAGV